MKTEREFKVAKYKSLDEILTEDPLGILKTLTAAPIAKTEIERLIESFQEIIEFYEIKGCEPEPDQSNISEFSLHRRLNSLRESPDKIEVLTKYDKYELLKPQAKEINSIDDIFNGDDLNILGDLAEDIFRLKNVPKRKIINKADLIGRSKVCRDFDKYEQQFLDVQEDLKKGARQQVDFTPKQLHDVDSYFVYRGVLLYLESVENLGKNDIRMADGRTRIIFENGKESNIMLDTLRKNLVKYGGKAVTANKKHSDIDFIEPFMGVTPEDDKTGFIYVLKSNSMDDTIASIVNLHKIGYSKNNVEDRIKNAEHEPTYLMASVSIVGTWQCFNMNPQKFEQLLHNFFGKTCLDLDVFDDNGKRHRPQEWFIVPIEAINQAIEMIISGVIVNYRYDQESESIVLR